MVPLLTLLTATFVSATATGVQGGLKDLFQILREDSLSGCNVRLLPDYVDWCDVEPNSHGIVGPETVCQPAVDLVPYYTCLKGTWREEWDLSDTGYLHRRRKRSGMGQAVSQIQNHSCSLFCQTDNTGDNPRQKPPYFSYCHPSITIHPDSPGENEVEYIWAEPVPNDDDGQVTSLLQLNVNNTPTTFQCDISPGLKYQITYIATDNDKLTWPCSFTITGEVRSCPPIEHPAHCNTSCSHGNIEGSNCTFVCDIGYELSGVDMITCLENEDWSDTPPICTPVTCDTHPDNVSSLVNGSFVCPAGQMGLYSVCWAKCSNTFTLRNDQYEEEHQALLIVTISDINETLYSARQSREIAIQEAEIALFTASNKTAEASDAYEQLLQAMETLAASVEDRNNANETYTEKVTLALQAERDAALATENGYSNATELQAAALTAVQVKNEAEALVSDKVQEVVMAEVDNETKSSLWSEAVIAAQAAVVQNTTAYSLLEERTEEVAMLETQLASLQNDLVRAITTAARDDKVINAYALCNENGTWTIPGLPQCVDLQAPTIICEPLLTKYLENDTISTSITWSLPEVEDNSGLDVNLTQMSGPENGDLLGSGLYQLEYIATDSFGNESPLCTQTISVQELYCGSPSTDIADSSMGHDCTGYQYGESCHLTCPQGYVLEGDTSITCERDDTVTPSRPYWSSFTSSCKEVQTEYDCPAMVTPDNGDVNCDNETTGMTCTVTCDEGYTLPYKTVNVFHCSEHGTWIPTIPGKMECIERGERQYTEYTANVSYEVDNCLLEATDTIQSEFLASLKSRLPAFDFCSLEYTCEANYAAVTCHDFESSFINITFSVLLTCSDVAGTYWVGICDLQEDRMEVLLSDVMENINSGHLLENLNGSLLSSSVAGVKLDVPDCGEGAVLSSAFCDRCQSGCFYSSSTDLCQPCPLGQYSSQPGSSMCMNCPVGLSTVTTGTTSLDDCRAECSPGRFSSTTLEPCLLCEMGYYQSQAGANNCVTKCPSGRSTAMLGSSSRNDCILFDLYLEWDVSYYQLWSGNKERLTVAFWLWALKVPYVTVGLYNADSAGDETFVLDTSDTSIQLLFNGWDNQPLESVTLKAGTWTMLVLTWDRETEQGVFYKDGQVVEVINTSAATRSLDQAVFISAAAGTVVAGLSISEEVAGPETVEKLSQACSVVPPGVIITTTSLQAADLRRAGIKHIPTICNATISTVVTQDQCESHACQNNGICQGNSSTGYTCNCTESYTGPFCQIARVDGDWSEWYNQTACSVTCGEGIQTLYRICNQPYPGLDGSACPGNATKMQTCQEEACPICPELSDDSGTRCVLDNDEVCTPFCPPGLVLPRGMHDIQYTCGKTTNYTWAPIDFLPACAESIRPLGYEAILQFSIGPAAPCSLVSVIELKLELVLQNTSCPVHNEQCTFSAIISECSPVESGSLRKRRQEPLSYLYVSYTVSLLSTDTFDLTQYYANSQQVSASILEAVIAISDLEAVVGNLEGNPQQLNILYNGVEYVINPVATSAATLCDAGLVPVEGVCVRCQQGTYHVSGWCVFCELGTYKEIAESQDCLLCPPGTTTILVGSRSSTQCLADPTYVQPQLDGTTSAAAVTEGETEGTNLMMIIAIVVAGVLIIAVIVIIVVYKLKKGKKSDVRGSQVIKVPGDSSYNMYYKRRHVMGFDKDGDPVISSEAIVRDYELEPAPNESGEAPLDQGLVVYPPVNQGPFVIKDSNMNSMALGDEPFTSCEIPALSGNNFKTPDFRKEKYDPLPKTRGIDRFRVPGRKKRLPLPIAVYQNGKIVLKQKPIPEDSYSSPRVPIPPKLPSLKFKPPKKLVTFGKSLLRKHYSEDKVPKEREYDEDYTDEDYLSGDEADTLIHRSSSGDESISKIARRTESPPPFKNTARAAALLTTLRTPQQAKPMTTRKKRKVLKVYDDKDSQKLVESAPEEHVPMVFNKDNEEQWPQSESRPLPSPRPPNRLYNMESPEPIPPPTMPKVFNVSELKTWPTSLSRPLPLPPKEVEQRTSTPKPPPWPCNVSDQDQEPPGKMMDSKQGFLHNSSKPSNVSDVFAVSPRDVEMEGVLHSMTVSNASLKTPRREKLSPLLFSTNRVHPDTTPLDKDTKPGRNFGTTGHDATPWPAHEEVACDEGANSSLDSLIPCSAETTNDVVWEKQVVESGPLSAVINNLPAGQSPRPGSAGSAQYTGLQNSVPPEDFREKQNVRHDRENIPVII